MPRLVERLGACTLIVIVERANIFAELCRAHGIEILYAFGSRAQEMADWVLGARPALAEPASDVDIGVKPKQGKSFSVR
jgi:predicted nucleotidyltransferase